VVSELRRGARSTTMASVEEDPNAAVACSSPPCFMHELDPSYLGYLGRDEVSALLGAVLAADWDGVPEAARYRAALRRRFEALGTVSSGATPSGAPGEPIDREPGLLARRVQAALPRLHDHALRRDLEEALGVLERARGPRRDSAPGEG